jgi:hypothetical protein
MTNDIHNNRLYKETTEHALGKIRRNAPTPSMHHYIHKHPNIEIIIYKQQ